MLVCVWQVPGLVRLLASIWRRGCTSEASIGLKWECRHLSASASDSSDASPRSEFWSSLRHLHLLCCIFETKRLFCTQKLSHLHSSVTLAASTGTLSVIIGVARIWCQEGHKSYWVFTWSDCRHIVVDRLCTGQSTLKKLNCCKSWGRAPVPHSWRCQWT